MRTSLFLLLPLALAATELHAQQTSERVVITGEGPPDVNEIVQRAVANDEQRHEHRLGFACDQIVTTERLDKAGTVFKTKTAHLVHHESDEAARSVAEDLPAESDRPHRDGDTVKAEHRLGVLVLRRLAPRFDYVLAGEAPVRGRACYLVEASPRLDQPANSREERVIDGLHARFWIDKGTFEILQGEGSLVRPVSVALFGSVTRMDFAFHTQTLPNGEVGPADLRTDLVVTAPFHFYRQRQSSVLEDWRLAGGSEARDRKRSK